MMVGCADGGGDDDPEFPVEQPARKHDTKTQVPAIQPPTLLDIERILGRMKRVCNRFSVRWLDPSNCKLLR